jgi:hypothetical protein
MNILALGDIIAPVAVDYLCRHLGAWKAANRIDLAVVNAENASFLAGIGPEAAARLLDAGADVLTGGNHTMQTSRIYSMLDHDPRLLRPLNFPADVPGYGSTVVRTSGGVRVLVLNAMGTAFMEPVLDSPFPYIERALTRARGEYDVAVMDFHAEATGEKLAVAHTFDGAFGAIWGTHTHVPTADMQVLPRGTGYVTDLGATAPTGGILGVRTEVICDRLRRKIPCSYQPAEGPVRAEGVVFEIDEKTALCRAVRRVVL